MWGVSFLCGEIITCPIIIIISFLFFVFICFMWEILLHTPCCFMCVFVCVCVCVCVCGGGSLTLLVLFCMQEVCFLCPMLFDIKNFSYSSYGSLCGEIF